MTQHVCEVKLSGALRTVMTGTIKQHVQGPHGCNLTRGIANLQGICDIQRQQYNGLAFFLALLCPCRNHTDIARRDDHLRTCGVQGFSTREANATGGTDQPNTAALPLHHGLVQRCAPAALQGHREINQGQFARACFDSFKAHDVWPNAVFERRLNDKVTSPKVTPHLRMTALFSMT